MPPAKINTYDGILTYQEPGESVPVRVGVVRSITPPEIREADVTHLASTEPVRIPAWKEPGIASFVCHFSPPRQRIPLGPTRLRELPDQGDGTARFELLDLPSLPGQPTTLEMPADCPEAAEARRVAREGRSIHLNLVLPREQPAREEQPL